MVNLQNTIHVENGYDHNAYTYYPVLIIGAGASGIAMGCRLKSVLGFDQFRIFERQSGTGGTWWINRYPGVACDVPTVFYSFSFFPNFTAKTLYPPGPQLIKYFNDVCQHYEIVDKIQLNTDVQEVRWLEEEQLWEATLVYMVPGMGDLGAKERQKHIAKHGEGSVYLKKEKVRAKIVVSAVGGLVEPKDFPDDIPGVDQFEGDIFHSARWNHNVNLAGKDIVVVGTGCSAAQFIPKLLKDYNAKSVTQLMRSPPWVVPRLKEPFGKEKFAKYAPTVFSTMPGLGYLLRFLTFLMGELDFYNLFRQMEKNAKYRTELEIRTLANMKKIVPEKYHEIMSPDYGLGCKRRIIDSDWFESMSDSKFDLRTQPLTSVQPRGVTLGPGRAYPSMAKESKAPTDQVQLPADVIVLGNGFDVTNWIHPLAVYGRGGKSIHDVWTERGGPQAYLGTAMDGFPNFFIIFGPNTATGHSSVLMATENMVNYSLKFIKPILDKDVDLVEVKKSAEVEWTKNIQKELKNTVFMAGGCRSWYYDPNGWNSTVYSRSQIDFAIRCMFPNWSHWDFTYTGKGLLKHRLSKLLKLAAAIAVFVGAYRLRKMGASIKDWPSMLIFAVRSTLVRALMAVEGGVRAVHERI